MINDKALHFSRPKGRLFVEWMFVAMHNKDQGGKNACVSIAFCPVINDILRMFFVCKGKLWETFFSVEYTICVVFVSASIRMP